MGHIDWAGLAVFITALGGFLGSMATIGLQIWTMARQSDNRRQIDLVHDCLHKKTEELKAEIRKSSI